MRLKIPLEHCCSHPQQSGLAVVLGLQLRHYKQASHYPQETKVVVAGCISAPYLLSSVQRLLYLFARGPE